MLKKPAAVLRLTALFCAVLFLFAFNKSNAQVSSPQNLNVTVDNGKAMLSWDAPENGTAVKYYIYKAYGADENADPSSLQFTKSDSSSSANYTDDLSSLSSSAQVAFYYITAVDANGSESSPSNFANAVASQKENDDGNNQ